MRLKVTLPVTAIVVAVMAFVFLRDPGDTSQISDVGRESGSSPAGALDSAPEYHEAPSTGAQLQDSGADSATLELNVVSPGDLQLDSATSGPLSEVVPETADLEAGAIADVGDAATLDNQAHPGGTGMEIVPPAPGTSGMTVVLPEEAGPIPGQINPNDDGMDIDVATPDEGDSGMELVLPGQDEEGMHVVLPTPDEQGTPLILPDDGDGT